MLGVSDPIRTLRAVKKQLRDKNSETERDYKKKWNRKAPAVPFSMKPFVGAPAATG